MGTSFFILLKRYTILRPNVYVSFYRIFLFFQNDKQFVEQIPEHFFIFQTFQNKCIRILLFLQKGRTILRTMCTYFTSLTTDLLPLATTLGKVA